VGSWRRRVGEIREASAKTEQKQRRRRLGSRADGGGDDGDLELSPAMERRDTAKMAVRAVPSQMKLNRVSGSFDEPPERTMGIGEHRRVRSALVPFDPPSGSGPRHCNKDGGVFAAVGGVDDDSELELSPAIGARRGRGGINDGDLWTPSHSSLLFAVG